MSRMLIWVAVMGLALMSPGTLKAQSNKPTHSLLGQSQDPQALDHWECHKQAVEQTGYDPSAPPDQGALPNRATSLGKAITGGALKEAARGAAVGAAVGAITGQAGKGAALGAAGGGAHGALGGLSAAGKPQQYPQPQQRWQEYQHALATCMRARGYSAK